jgi:hypothetical protein
MSKLNSVMRREVAAILLTSGDFTVPLSQLGNKNALVSIHSFHGTVNSVTLLHEHVHAIT